MKKKSKENLYQKLVTSRRGSIFLDTCGVITLDELERKRRQQKGRAKTHYLDFFSKKDTSSIYVPSFIKDEIRVHSKVMIGNGKFHEIEPDTVEFLLNCKEGISHKKNLGNFDDSLAYDLYKFVKQGDIFCPKKQTRDPISRGDVALLTSVYEFAWFKYHMGDAKPIYVVSGDEHIWATVQRFDEIDSKFKYLNKMVEAIRPNDYN